MTTHGRRCALGSVVVRVTATGHHLLIEGFPDSCTVLRRLAANVYIVCYAAELPKLVACWVRSLHLSAGCAIERIRYGFRAAEMTVGAQRSSTNALKSMTEVNFLFIVEAYTGQ